MTQRPLSLTIIGWFFILGAVFGLYSVAMMGSNPIVTDMMRDSPLPMSMHKAIGLVGAVIGGASGVLSLLITLLTLKFTTLMLLGVVMLGVFAFFLFRPAANAWFQQGGRSVAE